MALSKDVQILRVGAEGKHEPVAAPLKASATVYRGSIALIDNTGYLHNASTPAATDTCMGIIMQVAGGTQAETGPGITAPSTPAGAVWIDCATGTFLLASGTGADALSAATAGSTVYVIDEVTVGATNGSNTRPACGIQLPIPPGTPTGLVPVKMTNAAS